MALLGTAQFNWSEFLSASQKDSVLLDRSPRHTLRFTSGFPLRRVFPALGRREDAVMIAAEVIVAGAFALDQASRHPAIHGWPGALGAVGRRPWRQASDALG